jgi:hypothetical protein
MRFNRKKTSQADSASFIYEAAEESKHDNKRVVNSSDATLKMSLDEKAAAFSTRACIVGRRICIFALLVMVAIDLRMAVCTVSEERALTWERR